MTKDEILSRISGIDWYHSIDLGEGVVTPGRNKSPFWDKMNMPADMAGLTVLDIGAWDGYYSFECARRGAMVLATDSYAWENIGTKKQGFITAREILGLEKKVGDLDLPPEMIFPSTVGYHDYVLILGVIYHLKNPSLALQYAWRVTRKCLVVESHVNERFGNALPYAVYYPGSELCNEPTNWWGPNRLCLQNILETLEPAPAKVELVHFNHQLESDSRAIFKAWRE